MPLRPRGLPPSQWAVFQLPLDELWDDSGRLPLTKVRDLGSAEVADLLRGGPVRFVVAGVGSRLKWVPVGDCYRFWKAEVKPRLVEPAAERFRLEDFPGEYCYIAAEWAGGAEPVVVLEARH